MTAHFFFLTRMWLDETIEIDKRTTLAENGTRIVNQLRSKQTEYPLYRYTTSLSTLQVLVDNLVKYSPRWVRGLAKNTFRRKPSKKLVCRAHDWWTIDVLVDYFVEHVRIRAKKQKQRSAFDCWQNDDGIIKKTVQHYGQKHDSLDVVMFADGAYRYAKTRVPSTFRASRTRALLGGDNVQPVRAAATHNSV